MLLKLYIKDFALIDELEVSFKDGLNILTGETGAGKSIIIGAINLIIGERASSDYIRTGTDSTRVEAIFDYDEKHLDDLFKEYGIDKDDNQLIIQREITRQGRNFCRINGKSVTVTILKRFGKQLIDIHGQHQHQSLLNTENHIEMLDLLGGEEIVILKEKVMKYFTKSQKIVHILKNINKMRQEYCRQKEQLKYEIDEIEKSQLIDNEDILLEEESQVLENAEKIFQALAFSYDLLYQGSETPSVIDSINMIINNLEGIKSYFKRIEPQLDFLKSVLYELEDVASSIREQKESIDFEQGRLNQIQARLALIDRLKTKYNMNISELLEHSDKAKAKLDKIVDIDDKTTELTAKLNTVNSNLVNNALALHNLRKTVALNLEKNISKELQELGMKDVRFSVNISWEEDEAGLQVNTRKFIINEKGLDDIEFLISTNPGEPLKPLAKIVSGGETSRIMLALKSILAKVDNIPCLIFDEIDTGIGGRIAQIVGEKLSRVARNHQVLCVTHSPQIASLGDAHFLIKKEVVNQNTYTQIYEIEYKDRINELTRMLGGAKITSHTVAHAEEMLKMAQKIKHLQQAL